VLIYIDSMSVVPIRELVRDIQKKMQLEGKLTTTDILLNKELRDVSETYPATDAEHDV